LTPFPKFGNIVNAVLMLCPTINILKIIYLYLKEKKQIMEITTKYNIGDIVSIIDYYSNIIYGRINEITIDQKMEIIYTVGNFSISTENIRVYENPTDDCEYRILKLIGNDVRKEEQ
jgi:hypothetical protein